jgi:hypothetical protein
MLKKIETALSYYEMMKASQKKYYEKGILKKKEEGTYRGRGRPRKVPVAEPVAAPVIPTGPTGPVEHACCSCRSFDIGRL